MDSFSTYTAELGEYTGKVLISPAGSFKSLDIQESLFSTQQVEAHLRSLIPIGELRDAGSFFTGDDLAADAVLFFGDSISRKSVIVDPACGAGNLLIACSKKLPVVKCSLQKTLTIWGKCLIGFDLFEEFVEATKLRLILEAISRGVRSDITDLEGAKGLLAQIREVDAFDCSNIIAKATHVILNPPFYKTLAGEGCEWADGKVNAAAKFVVHVLMSVGDGTLISAILPDVLRSGSLSEKWRVLVSSKMKCSVLSSGRFDSKTDVDVFLLTGEVETSCDCQPDWLGVESSSECLGDLFDISIGPVVPYRDKKEGEPSPYIHPKNLSHWKTVRSQDIEESWNFSGTLKKPPFVAIRRTSSPSDAFRATGTLITGKLKIAVENHLIIARPKSRKVGDCRRLLEVLKNTKTSDFLNQRIRCRHLTVSAVKEIPWIGDLP